MCDCNQVIDQLESEILVLVVPLMIMKRLLQNVMINQLLISVLEVLFKKKRNKNFSLNIFSIKKKIHLFTLNIILIIHKLLVHQNHQFLLTHDYYKLFLIVVDELLLLQLCKFAQT